MKELNFNVEKVKISLGELSCEVKKATHIEAMEFEEKLATEGANFKALVEEFLVSLGMTKEVHRALTMAQLLDVLEAVKGLEKN